MARADTLIDELRNEIKAMGNAFDRIAGIRRRYDALGGKAFTDTYFVQQNIDPATGTAKATDRTDLDIKPENIADAFASIDAINALLAQGHMTNLAKMIR